MATATVRGDVPFHLRGNFAPVGREVSAEDLPVKGALPPDLNGLYVRNGPNPRSGVSAHWFLGDGMLHGVELSGGRARCYRNRWMRTRTFLDGADVVGPDGSVDLTTGAANTHVVRHAGRMLALVESSFPTEVTPDLETVGPFDFGGRLTTAMTAHPKICPLTGEMLFFGYGFAPPYLTYHRADAQGNLVQSEVIEVPGPTMIHDFNVTASRVVFMDLPVVFDMELAMRNTMPYRWSDDYGARLGVMPRDGTNADVRWFDIEPCYVFHPLNAYDEGKRVVIEVCRYPELWRADSDDFTVASMWRFTIDPATGKVREEQLDDRPVEFPRVDDRRVGLHHRHGFAVQTGNDAITVNEPRGLVKYDVGTGKVESFEFPAGESPGEAVMAPAADGEADDEGYLLTYVFDANRDTSDLVVFDANDIRSGPVARVELPQRVPFGFHGSWMPE